MTDDEVISVLVDTEAGLGPTEGYGPTIDHVRTLIAHCHCDRDPIECSRQALVGEYQEARAEVMTLRSALAEVYFWLGPPQPQTEKYTDVPGLVQKAMHYRDRLQEVVKAVAYDGESPNTPQEERIALRVLAKAALEGQPRIVVHGEPTSAEYQQLVSQTFDIADERDRLAAELEEARKKINHFLAGRVAIDVGDEVEITHRAVVLEVDDTHTAEDGAPVFTVRYGDGSTGRVEGWMVHRGRSNEQWKGLYDVVREWRERS